MKDDSFLKWQGRVREETPALVAVITRRKDFEILKRERWYRIPVKTAPKGLKMIKFIAFYQTKVFGEEKWAVNYKERKPTRDAGATCQGLPYIPADG
ncbi:MAG: hypothetical protein ABIK39_05575 [candidate division WOR-3 bacterium]